MNLSAVQLGICGTWHSVLESDRTQDGIFRITEDLRYVSFAEDTSKDRKRQWIPMRLWCILESDSVVRFKPIRNSDGWTRRFYFSADKLIFESIDTTPFKKWLCDIMKPEDIPDWFEEEFTLAAAREWK